MKRIIAIALVLIIIGTVYAQPISEPKRTWWVFQGFGVDMVQCELIDNQVTHCHYLREANLNGIMEAVHRATKASVR